MELDEIVLPDTEPETEWIRGRAVQKVSPKRDHSRVQTVLAALLSLWAEERGEVGTEWRFRIAVPGEPRRPLVPDVSFVSHVRLQSLRGEDFQVPPFAPDLAVEILSKGDDPRDVASKIAVYLAGGSDLVLIVDPGRRTIVAHDALVVRRFEAAETFEHAALPRFTFSVGAFFERALRRGR